jgi:hypothetical protein
MESNALEKTPNDMRIAHKRNPLFEREEFPLKGNFSSLSKHTTNIRVKACATDAQIDAQRRASEYGNAEHEAIMTRLRLLKQKADDQSEMDEARNVQKWDALKQKDPKAALRILVENSKAHRAKHDENETLPELDTHNPNNVLAPCPNRPGEQMGFLGGIQAHFYRDERGYDMISFIEHPAFDSTGKYRDRPPPTDSKRQRNNRD